MAINVETGSGSATSETLCSVAYADTWHASRGCAPWATLTTDQKEQALRRASDYFEQSYGNNFKGRRLNSTQALSWPRNYVERDNGYYPSDSVPNEVKNACAELAFKAAGGDLSPDIAQRVIRKKIGPIEVEYDKNGVQYKTYRAINNMLAPFLNGLGGAFKKVIRT